ncbi:MAG: DNA repair ATPase [Deltaproteobacteria bacterium]|nr:DNA repair ATPase [Deltaproteobacteria bacterium]
MGEPMSETSTLEQGTYEVVRDRLLEQAGNLKTAANRLNTERLELFGSTEMSVVGSERIRTQNNCVPRDIAAVGDRLLFGYNVFIGLRHQTTVRDVFSLHTFEATQEGFSLTPLKDGAQPDFLADPTFLREFEELYQYYKSARLLQLRRVEDRLLAVFQAGSTLGDIKVFRWAIAPDGRITYIDNRGERDHQFPPSHDFEWTPTTRDHFVSGRHPHVTILDEVFVETVGGDLTIKIENNTEDGLGIYREPVDDADQSLDDAEIHYAQVGVLILLKVKPYREETWRYLVFNTRTKQVQRIDAIGQACVQLPEDHGIIFPGGFYLQSGETRTFDAKVAQLEFKHALRSPNGEDVLYLFHHREQGRTVMLPYNVIRKEVSNPVECHGFTFFDDGKMVIFRCLSEEPTRVHPMQVWQTPFSSAEHAAAAPSSGSYLEKVGNADLVRGISDLLSLCRMVEEQQASRLVYEDLIASANRVIDSYFWLGSPEVGQPLDQLKEVRTTAELIVDEFEKVEAIRSQATEAVDQAAVEVETLLGQMRPKDWSAIEPFVEGLSQLRQQRGRLISLRELRYADPSRLDSLEEQVSDRFDQVSQATVSFLVEKDAFAPFHRRLKELEQEIEVVQKVSEARPLRESIDSLSSGFDLLAEVVSGLDIDDATVRTGILEGVSEVLGGLNRCRALQEARRKELLSHEMVAEFAVQFQLFNQSVAGALSLGDTPEACDEQLSKLMLQLEELESRFSEFEEYLEQLGAKREDVYEAFSAKKQRLLDERQRRANHLMQAAERILGGIARRAATLSEGDELNSYFAADAMVSRLRDLSSRLRELGDSVRADEVDARLKGARQEAVRSLRDRQDIFEEGTDVLKLGRHRFSVNTQNLDLTLIPREGHLELHLTGTDFHQPLEDSQLEELRPLWDQHLVSENPQVYRGEYLAACLLAAAEEESEGLSPQVLQQAALSQESLLERVRRFSAERYDEGYERGLHDADATLILSKLLGLYATAGLLRFAPKPRAAAVLFWACFKDELAKKRWQRRAQSLARLRRAFAHSPEIVRFCSELATAIGTFSEQLGFHLDPEDQRSAGQYLFEEICQESSTFVLSAGAQDLRRSFEVHLEKTGSWREFQADMSELVDHLPQRYSLAKAWIEAYLDQRHQVSGTSTKSPNDETKPAAKDVPLGLAAEVDGAVALILTEGLLSREPSSALLQGEVEGLLGQHGRISQRKMTLRLDEFLARLGAFRHSQVPAFRRFQECRHQALEENRRQLRLEEYRPRVMSAFVRNRLLNEVYLPLVGDNLAKQMGALGDDKRTDQMGLLLLISPPGYGKTTLMEYVANRLGLVFMKINGPALGHGVHSLDPAEAPNATARREVEKMNLSFEMGNNVLLYLDDIQHTHPELLQKFISLCDAQRKVEGVWQGQTKAYDLRGKRFAVCMAGNPYTESGDKFQVPDMLANRADVYNLGDILEGKEETFALSYLENALTSNPVTAPLGTRDPQDTYLLVRMAQGEQIQADQLSHGYSAAEVGEILAVLRKFLAVQQVLLEVNRQYILSAAQDPAFRTEPPFQLQGSYRNMNKLAEKIVPVMNDDELEVLLDNHYLGEAQTLTTGAEHNLLKLAELRGRLTPEEQARWAEIKRGFARVLSMGGAEDDPSTRVVGQLGLMSDRLGEIGSQLKEVAESTRETARSEESDAEDRGTEELAATLTPILEQIQASLALSRESSTGEELAGGEALQKLDHHLASLSKGMEKVVRVLSGAAAELKNRVPAVDPSATTGLATNLAAAPAQDFSPYLESLSKTLATLAEAPRGREIVQTLGPGVHDLMGRLVGAIEEALIPAVRSLGRRVQGSEAKKDRLLSDQLDGTLKHLDQLRDLVGALRKIDLRTTLPATAVNERTPRE